MSDLKNSIYLIETVKMACADLREDLSVQETRFLSWALRGLKELTSQTISLGTRREIIPIHHNTNTASIPCDATRVLSVSIINECNEKVELTYNGNLVGQVEKKECVDKCNHCGEDVDVCEKLVVTVDEKDVLINNVTYKETTTKRLIGNEYFQITNIPYLDIGSNTVVFREEKKFLTLLDRNDCGCIRSTEANIQAIKSNCEECYTCCYAPCVKYADDIAYYSVSINQGLIYFSKGIPYDEIYIEYQAGLPKENGKILLPEYAAEVITYYIKWKYYEHKRGARAERIDAFQMYKIQKTNMKLSLRKLPLETVIRLLHRTPTFALNVPNDYYGGGTTPKSGIIKEVGDTIINVQNNFDNETDIARDGW